MKDYLAERRRSDVIMPFSPMFLLMTACLGGAPVSTIESPPTSTTSAPSPFSCETAAAALGRPDWQVYVCNEMPEPRGLFAVTLEGPDGAREGHLVPVNANGFATLTSGIPAASAWLRSRGLVDDSSSLTLTGLTNVLTAFDAYPEAFNMDARSFIDDAIGSSTFTTPFKLTLYTPHPENRPLGEKRFLRAILEPNDSGKLVWRLAAGMANEWIDGEVIAAE
jgi:hypothetical protein